jgi:formate C-acetyltransferase
MERKIFVEQWYGFQKGNWCEEIDVRDFIQLNYKPYEGDDSFLEGPTEATNKLWEQLKCLNC